MSPQLSHPGNPRLLPRPRTPPRQDLPPAPLPTHPNSLVRLPSPTTHLSQTMYDAFPPLPLPSSPLGKYYPKPFPELAPFTTKEVAVNPPAKEDKQVREFWRGMRMRGLGVGRGVGGMYAGRWHPGIGVVGGVGAGALGYGMLYAPQPPMTYGGYVPRGGCYGPGPAFGFGDEFGYVYRPILRGLRWS
ncbi:hypothetical protein IAR50_007333 [Cryptococcus sp. DSM 104548]